LITHDDGVQHAFPVIGTIDIAVTKQRSFNITKLIEYEQGMVTGITEMTIVSRAFLSSERRTIRTVHVEYNFFDEFALMTFIDPFSRLVYQGFEVFGCVRISVSNRPIWLIEAAVLSFALSPTT